MPIPIHCQETLTLTAETFHKLQGLLGNIGELISYTIERHKCRQTRTEKGLQLLNSEIF